MTLPEQCINTWLSRRPDGSLRYPLTVRAHLELIMKLAPHALSEAEVERLNKIHWNQKTLTK